MTKDELNKIYDRFYRENNNKYVERVDMGALNQCFDLAIYFNEYLGFPKTIYSGLTKASQIYTSWNHSSFQKVVNTPEYVPAKGDIVVWGNDYNSYYYNGKKILGAGHVAIATGEGNTSWFKAFSQNVPLKSNSHIVIFNYNFVLGAQRLKTSGATPTPTPPTDLGEKKKVQFDRATIALNAAGLIPTAASEYWFDNPADPDKFTNYIKKLARDAQ